MDGTVPLNLPLKYDNKTTPFEPVCNNQQRATVPLCGGFVFALYFHLDGDHGPDAWFAVVRSSACHDCFWGNKKTRKKNHGQLLGPRLNYQTIH